MTSTILAVFHWLKANRGSAYTLRGGDSTGCESQETGISGVGVVGGVGGGDGAHLGVCLPQHPMSTVLLNPNHNPMGWPPSLQLRKGGKLQVTQGHCGTVHNDPR